MLNSLYFYFGWIFHAQGIFYLALFELIFIAYFQGAKNCVNNTQSTFFAYWLSVFLEFSSTLCCLAASHRESNQKKQAFKPLLFLIWHPYESRQKPIKSALLNKSWSYLIKQKKKQEFETCVLKRKSIYLGVHPIAVEAYFKCAKKKFMMQVVEGPFYYHILQLQLLFFSNI